MNTFSKEQIELKNHIESSNALILEEANRNGHTVVMYPCSDPAVWAEYGVYNIAQYEHHSAAGMHCDLFKDVHGCKPRWIDYSKLSTDEINEDITRLIEIYKSIQDFEEEVDLAAQEAEAKVEAERLAKNAYMPNLVFSDLKNLLHC